MKEPMKLFYPLLLLPFLAGCPKGKCGDNTQDENEGCDDGNTLDADGCEANCSLPACNNGINDPGELCFGAPSSASTDSAPAEVVSADFDNDGHQDLATANSAGQSISILLGDGTGIFERQAEVEIGQFVTFVVAGDFDGDGNQDLAVPVQNLNRTEVFRGAGDGSFTPLTQLTSTSPTRALVADLNEDSDEDIVVSSNNGIDLFLNNNAGGFDAPQISFIGADPRLVAADFNGDDNLDIAAGIGGALVLLLGDGIGNLAPQTAQLDGEVQGDISVADFDGDLELDLAIAQPSDGLVAIVGNQGGIFSISQAFPAFNAFAITTTDLNTDNVPDIAIASDVDIDLNAHLIVISSSAQAFNAQDPILVGNGNLRDTTTDDFNEDGVPDIILTDTTNSQVFVFLSQP
jgi:cysteine-rich repeat protein